MHDDISIDGFAPVPPGVISDFLPVGLKLDDLPHTVTSVGTVINAVKLEDRHDIELGDTDVGKLRLDPLGRLIVPGSNTPIPLEDRGLSLLLGRLNPLYPHATQVMRIAPTWGRAALFNSIIGKYQGLAERPLVLRTRRAHVGAPHAVYAVVTPSYARVDSDVVLADVAQALLDTLPRGPASYDAATTSALTRALWAGPAMSGDADCPSFMGLEVRTRDDAGGSVWVSAFCTYGSVGLKTGYETVGQIKPLSIRWPSGSMTFRRVHRGDVGAFKSKLHVYAERIQASVEKVQSMWEHAEAADAAVLFPSMSKPQPATTTAVGTMVGAIAADKSLVLGLGTVKAATTVLTQAAGALSLFDDPTYKPTAADAMRVVSAAKLYAPADDGGLDTAAGRLLLRISDLYGFGHDDIVDADAVAA